MEPSSSRGAGSGAGDASFVGSVPDLYDRLLVPMLFREPAELLADAVARDRPHDVLETAAGTGVLTQAVRRRLADAALTATDLNPPMLARAVDRPGLDGVTWQQADAQALPFADGSFDVVACQFGVMFFPDKPRAYAEAARVLRPGGRFVLNVWDRIEANELPHVIEDALAAAAPEEPLLFMGRTPHGYADPAQVEADLVAGGLRVLGVSSHDGVARTTVTDAATAFCQGTPLRGEVERHPTLDVERATAVAREALVQRFGDGPVEAATRWLQVEAVRD